MWKSVRFKCSANTPWKDAFVCRLRIQKDDSPLNPYMFVSYDGTVISEEDMKVVSTCKMDVHKFPFDTQRCNITIGSAIHYGEGGVCLCGMLADSVVMGFFFSPLIAVDEIQLLPFSNSSRATQFSREVMKTQGEWEFLQLSVTSSNFTFHDRQWEQLIYTVRNSGTDTDGCHVGFSFNLSHTFIFLF